MGFDVYGLNPKDRTGEYFRNNVWWWRRLADFVLEHVELPKKEALYWHSNDGQEVSEASALRIAQFLKEALLNRRRHFRWVRESEERYLEMEKRSAEQIVMTKLKDRGLKVEQVVPPESSYPFSWDNIERFARFCESSGGFRIC